MGVRERHQAYALPIGAVTFFVGIAFFRVIVPESSLGDAALNNAAAAYLYTHGGASLARGVPVLEWGRIIELPGPYATHGGAVAIPFSIAAVGSILVNDAMGYTKNPRHIATNTVWGTAGYVVAGAATYLIAAPTTALSGIIRIVLALGIMLLLGSVVVRQFTAGLPIFGVVSLGTLIGVGLVTVFGAVALFLALFPVAIVALVGFSFGSGALLAVRVYS